MEGPVTEIHQVGSTIIHLTWERIESSQDFLGLFEGGGVYLANTFPSRSAAELWLKRLLKEMHPHHRCGLGCMRFPGAEFLAELDVLERLV